MGFCPICRREAAVIPEKSRDADEFDCSRHGKFKVSGTVFAIDRDKRATPEQWEAALEKSKARQPTGAAPLILSYDFS
jgi:hypothetical protein